MTAPSLKAREIQAQMASDYTVGRYGVDGVKRVFRELAGNPALLKDSDLEYIARLTCASILTGKTFTCSKEIGNLIATAAEQLPPTWRMTPEMLFEPCGFVWLEEPVSFADENMWPLWAFAWTPVHDHFGKMGGAVPITNDLDPSLLGSNDALFMVSFTALQGQVPMPTMGLTYRINSSIAEMFDSMNEQNSISADMGRTLVKTKFMATFLSFITQKILIPYPQPIPRALRRRQVGSLLISTGLNVIKLRRHEQGQANDEGGGPEWSCRWMVRGHWRNQWYATRKTHSPKWITPHVKGPEDKPLRLTDSVYSVVR